MDRKVWLGDSLASEKANETLRLWATRTTFLHTLIPRVFALQVTIYTCKITSLRILLEALGRFREGPAAAARTIGIRQWPPVLKVSGLRTCMVSELGAVESGSWGLLSLLEARSQYGCHCRGAQYNGLTCSNRPI